MTAMRPVESGFGLLFELIRDAVVVADVETERICLRNNAAEEMVGYSSAQAAGLPLEALVAVNANLELALESEQEVSAHLLLAAQLGLSRTGAPA